MFHSTVPNFIKTEIAEYFQAIELPMLGYDFATGIASGHIELIL